MPCAVYALYNVLQQAAYGVGYNLTVVLQEEALRRQQHQQQGAAAAQAAAAEASGAAEAGTGAYGGGGGGSAAVREAAAVEQQSRALGEALLQVGAGSRDTRVCKPPEFLEPLHAFSGK